MIYEHQQRAIDYISAKFQADSQVNALLISGSIAHGFNTEESDVDINIVVSDAVYEQKSRECALTYFESADSFYSGGYFDGKFITTDYLSLVAERGNEPTRFALHDAKIVFDKTGKVAEHLKKIGTYKADSENAVRFAAQLEAWKWYCGEAIKKGNQYLLDLSVSKLILFAGRLILLENKMFFPYHKWFLRVLEKAENKPEGLIPAIGRLLADKSPDNISLLYEMIKNYRDWSNGEVNKWSAHFLVDIETVWMRQDDFVENI